MKIDGIRPPTDLEAAIERLSSSRKIVAFTGAGISAASGIATFRDPEGLWNRFPPEDFATWKGLMRTSLLQPRRLAEFLLAVLDPIASAVPNAAHQALVDLSRLRELTIVTQNIDGLHQAAGSAKVLGIHGSILEIMDVRTGEHLRSLTRSELAEVVEKLRAAMAGGWTALSVMSAVKPLLGGDLTRAYRPNLVLFGDTLAEPAWSRSLQSARECDLLLCIGTSGIVHPAAMVPETARAHGASVITIDPVTASSELWLQGAAEQVLPDLVKGLRQRNVAAN